MPIQIQDLGHGLYRLLRKHQPQLIKRVGAWLCALQPNSATSNLLLQALRLQQSHLIERHIDEALKAQLTASIGLTVANQPKLSPA